MLCAIKMESDGAEFQPKRGKRYTGNSARTKRFHAQKRRTLQGEGQKFISHCQWFPAKNAELYKDYLTNSIVLFLQNNFQFFFLTSMIF
jgi:hypothetical protein